MQPLEACIWHHVPGYDSDSDDDVVGEAHEDGDAEVAKRLAVILEVLSDRWMEAPLVPFAPVKLPKGSAKESPSKAQDASSRWWRRSTTLPASSGVFQRSLSAPKFRLEHTAAPIVRETCVTNGLQQVPDQDFCLMWSGPGMKDLGYKDLHEFQRVNHFPGSTELTRKDAMFEHLSEMARDFGSGAFDFVPETFVLPEQADAFLQAYRRTGGLWIVKPSNAACGRGIFIFRNLAMAQLSLAESSVVSRYVANPLLIQTLKFDLRVYVAVTQYDPLRAYIYREGLARFASAPYSTEDACLSDAYRHLTNYSINKSAPNFCENAEVRQDNYGHKWSLSAFNKHLKCMGANVGLLWSRIMDLIVKTLFAVEPTIGSRTRKVLDYAGVCFEIYGFDVLVDDTLKPWILEVNLSPSMQAESPLDWQVKSSLLSDAFNLVGVCNPDGRMIRASRARAQLLQARVAHRKLIQERGSFTGLSVESKERRRPATVPLRSGRECTSIVAEVPVVLENLSEGQLKVLARSLQEFGRVHNFIRLYPTKLAVERYAPITTARSRGCRAASQLLASVLYGPPPIVSEAWARGKPDDDLAQEPLEGAAQPRAPEPPPSVGTAVLGTAAASATRRASIAEGRRGAFAKTDAREERKERKGPDEKQVLEEPKEVAPEIDEPRSKAKAAKDLAGETYSESPVDGVDVQVEVEEDDDDREGAEATSRPCSSPSQADVATGGSSSSSFCSPTGLEQEEPGIGLSQAIRAVEALDPGERWRLLLMEYLLRVGRTCEALTSKERALVAQSSSFARLSMFIRRVRNVRVHFAATAARGRYSRSRSPALSPSEDEEDSDLEGGTLIDEIIAVCRRAVRALACQAWPLPTASCESPRPTSPGKRRLDRRIRELAKVLPPEFARCGARRAALEALPVLGTADLEGLLQSPGCVEEFEMLLDLFTATEREPRHGALDWERPQCQPSHDFSARRASRSAPAEKLYSPLSELVGIRGHLRHREPRAMVSSISLPLLRAPQAHPQGRADLEAHHPARKGAAGALSGRTLGLAGISRGWDFVA